ncbi:MAG: hypothetical protein DRP87_14090 [Spirochaetes bacterium]|nr:MAG: hypothetical protein DRP87_14090 [Spirochaetota bacterium]
MIVVSHGARLKPDNPPNIVKGVEACIENGILYIEVDLAPLEYGDFILFHDERLDRVTNKTGDVFTLDQKVRDDLRYRVEREKASIEVSSLSQIVKLVREKDGVKELQLDLKVHASSLLDKRILKNLIETIEPVRDSVRISSCADWIIQKLHQLDEKLKLGFDPQFYIDSGKRQEAYPPFKRNRFGYLDDHPIAHQRWSSASDYLSTRADSLWNIGSYADVWYVRYEFLLESLSDGFDWVSYLHSKGIKVCAWTVDLEGETMEDTVDSVLHLKVDRVTTNTPLIWWDMLKMKNVTVK